LGGCGKRGHLAEKCWILHPELKAKFLLEKKGGKNQPSFNGKDAEGARAINEEPLVASAESKKRPLICRYHTGEVRDKVRENKPYPQQSI
jgi:hypothetical protein